MPELREKLFSNDGTTTAIGTINTFIDTNLQVDSRDWLGSRGEIFIDDKIHEFKCTNYDKASGTITFNPAFTALIPVDTNYVIRLSYQVIIDKAFDRVIKDIRAKVGIAAGYIDSNIIKDLIVFKTIEIISKGNIEAENDKWDLRKNDFKESYKTELSSFFEPYDKDGDGNISEAENRDRPAFNNVELTRG